MRFGIRISFSFNRPRLDLRIIFIFGLFSSNSRHPEPESAVVQRPGHANRRLDGEAVAVIINNWQHRHSTRTTLNASARHNSNYFLSFRLPGAGFGVSKALMI